MKVCVISDTHDRIDYLHAALEDAKARGAEVVLQWGDVGAAYTLKRARQFGLPIHVIHGNNKGDLAIMGKLSEDPESLIEYHGRDATIHLNGKRIFLVHFPNYAQSLALTGKYDLVCCGHNHRCKIESVQHAEGEGTTLIVNPGSASGMDRVQPSYVLGDLESMEFEILPIPEPELPPFKPCSGCA